MTRDGQLDGRSLACARSKPAASPVMTPTSSTAQRKVGSIAEAAREAIKDLDESLLDVDTNYK